MATWLTHLRVAERVADQINISDRSLFFAGSIAPDSDMLSDISHIPYFDVLVQNTRFLIGKNKV